MEKIRELDKLCSGLSYHVTGREFNVCESTIHIKYGVFKQKHTLKQGLYRSVNNYDVTKDLQAPGAVHPQKPWFDVH